MRTVFYLVTKKHNTDTPSYESFTSCLRELREICLKKQIKMLALPNGLDKMNWDTVTELLNRFLVPEIKCTVYLDKETPNEKREENEENLDLSLKIKKLQRQDKFIKEFIVNLKKRKQKGFILEDDILFKIRKGKNRRIYKQLVVPEAIKEDIFKLCHDNFTGTHLGEKKTWVKLSNRFYWKNSYKETMNYVKSCPVCACIKDPPMSRANLKPILDYEKPFDKVGVDILELIYQIREIKCCGIH